MADSSGTWLKLPKVKWQFIPPEIRDQASKLDLTFAVVALLGVTSTISMEPPVACLGLREIQSDV